MSNLRLQLLAVGVAPITHAHSSRPPLSIALPLDTSPNPAFDAGQTHVMTCESA